MSERSVWGECDEAYEDGYRAGLKDGYRAGLANWHYVDLLRAALLLADAVVKSASRDGSDWGRYEPTEEQAAAIRAYWAAKFPPTDESPTGGTRSGSEGNHE